MIKQSAYVIALLLGTASAHSAAPESVSLFATGMNGDEDLGQDIIMKGEKFHYVGKDAGLVQLQEDPTPEKVVVMEPIPNQALSNGAAGEGLEAFPNAPRTAFYAQYDEENQLWRQQLAQGPLDGLPYTQQVAGPDTGAPIGKTVHDAAIDGCDAQPMDRKPNGKYAQVSEPGDGYGQDGPATTNHNANLGEDRRDKWVYEFSRENVPPFATHAQHGKRDIGEGNMDESVHTFASEDTNVLPLPRRRRQTAYDGNGSGEKAHSLMEKVHHHHHHKRDIGEGNIDEEVHGVASADTHVLGTQHRRAEAEYAPNGSGEKAHSLLQHHHHHHKRDIGEGNIDEEVHGVASADTHVLPMPRRRRQTAYANNGSGEKSHSLMEKAHHHHHHHDKKDIGEGNIDEEVHGVASADTHVLPIPRRRRQTAYANNGSDPKSHAQLEKDKKDIGEGNIDEEVHGVASADTHVLPIPRRRRQTAYANNGSGEKSHSLAELEKGDIANKQVRTDVYTTVDNMIGQIPAYRRKTAPKHKFVPFKSGQGIEGDNNGPSGVVTAAKGAALAQVTGDDKEAPAGDIGAEKVSQLLPLEYQHRANTNTPNKRTTFYAETN